MPDPYHEDCDPLILDVADQAAVAHAVLPEAAQLRALQRFAEAAGVVEQSDTFS